MLDWNNAATKRNTKIVSMLWFILLKKKSKIVSMLWFKCVSNWKKKHFFSVQFRIKALVYTESRCNISNMGNCLIREILYCDYSLMYFQESERLFLYFCPVISQSEFELTSPLKEWNYRLQFYNILTKWMPLIKKYKNHFAVSFANLATIVVHLILIDSFNLIEECHSYSIVNSPAVVLIGLFYS